MAYAVQTRSENPANALRDALDEAETIVVSVNAENVEDFLVLLDSIEESFEALAEQQELDLRPEHGRWESLLRRLSTKPGPVASAAAKAGGYKALRAKHPPAESFWWHLDEEVQRQRWKMLKRTAIIVVSVIVVVGGGLWFVDTFFPPDPDTLLMVESQSQIDERMFQQDWEGALDVVTETRDLLPDEPELMIWEAVLSERLGDTEAAEASLAEAQETMADQPELFWVTTGNYRLMSNDPDGAVVAAQAALEVNPDSAPAHFLLANVAETLGERIEAIDLLEKVFLLAEEDNPQLAVIAKVRMGQLMQQFDPFETAAEDEPADGATTESTAEPTVEP